MEEELPARGEGASAANETKANSTPQQVEVAEAAEPLSRWPSVSLRTYFSSLALQAVQPGRAQAEPEDATDRGESAGLARRIAGLSICSGAAARGRAREESPPEEQQLRPAAKRLCRGPGRSAEHLAGFKLPKAYFCGYCSRVFHNAAFYCRHLRRHRNLWVCDKCNRGFETPSLKGYHRKWCVKLMRHQNKHKYYG